MQVRLAPRRKLAEHGITCGGHAARQLTKNDYKEFDLLIGMDSANLRNMHRIWEKLLSVSHIGQTLFAI